MCTTLSSPDKLPTSTGGCHTMAAGCFPFFTRPRNWPTLSVHRAPFHREFDRLSRHIQKGVFWFLDQMCAICCVATITLDTRTGTTLDSSIRTCRGSVIAFCLLTKTFRSRRDDPPCRIYWVRPTKWLAFRGSASGETKVEHLGDVCGTALRIGEKASLRYLDPCAHLMLLLRQERPYNRDFLYFSPFRGFQDLQGKHRVVNKPLSNPDHSTVMPSNRYCKQIS